MKIEMWNGCVSAFFLFVALDGVHVNNDRSSRRGVGRGGPQVERKRTWLLLLLFFFCEVGGCALVVPLLVQEAVVSVCGLREAPFLFQPPHGDP